MNIYSNHNIFIHSTPVTIQSGEHLVVVLAYYLVPGQGNLEKGNQGILIMLYTFSDPTISITRQPPNGGQVTSHIGPPTNITLLPAIKLPCTNCVE